MSGLNPPVQQQRLPHMPRGTPAEPGSSGFYCCHQYRDSRRAGKVKLGGGRGGVRLVVTPMAYSCPPPPPGQPNIELLPQPLLSTTRCAPKGCLPFGRVGRGCICSEEHMNTAALRIYKYGACGGRKAMLFHSLNTPTQWLPNFGWRLP